MLDMPALMNRRVAAALPIGVAFLFAMLTAASSADAATYYACVKKNGTGRIYSSKPKCKKGEKKISWNSEGIPGSAGKAGAPGKEGVAGKNGSNGSNGSNGLNGAVAGFFGGGSTGLALTSTEQTVGEKVVPAGHFLVYGLVEVGTEASKAGLTGVKCKLLDEKVELDSDYNDEPLAEFSKTQFFGIVTLPVMAVLNTTAPSTLSLSCAAYFSVVGSAVTADKWAVSALQTSSNG
jgi:hypothetical protein